MNITIYDANKVEYQLVKCKDHVCILHASSIYNIMIKVFIIYCLRLIMI
jgi:hypothetical protein